MVAQDMVGIQWLGGSGGHVWWLSGWGSGGHAWWLSGWGSGGHAWWLSGWGSGGHAWWLSAWLGFSGWGVIHANHWNVT